MADTNYDIPENPEYDENIRKLENDDPAHADDIFNPLFQKIINNIHSVKQETDVLNESKVPLENGEAKAQGVNMGLWRERYLGRIADMSGSASLNRKVDIEMPDGYITGWLEIELAGLSHEDQTGRMTKRYNVFSLDSAAIGVQDTSYTNADLPVSGRFALSDMRVKNDRRVITVSFTTGGNFVAGVFIRLFMTDNPQAIDISQITLSDVYTNDATVYPAPISETDKKLDRNHFFDADSVIMRNVAMYNLTDNITGMIKIKLPTGFTGPMFRCAIKGWHYSNAWELDVGGYLYGGGGYEWYMASAECPKRNFPGEVVRFGKDAADGRACIILGLPGSFWQYPVIAVTEAISGYIGSSLVGDWEITNVEDLSSIVLDADYGNFDGMYVNKPVWYDLVLQNGFTTHSVAQFAKINGVVYVKGRVTGLAGIVLPISNLPAGFRPDQPVPFVAPSTGTNTDSIFMLINPTGEFYSYMPLLGSAMPGGVGIWHISTSFAAEN